MPGYFFFGDNTAELFSHFIIGIIYGFTLLQQEGFDVLQELFVTADLSFRVHRMHKLIGQFPPFLLPRAGDEEIPESLEALTLVTVTQGVVRFEQSQ